MPEQNTLILLAESAGVAAALAPVPGAGRSGGPEAGGGAGREMPSASLPGAEARLWRATGRGDRVWREVVAAPAALAGWSHVVLVAAADHSQFDALREMATTREPWPGPVACVAAGGRGFHGHRGRDWVTEPGNLHLSVACVPDLDAASCGLSMTALPAVAACEALRDLGSWRAVPGIKWVNDLLIAGAKVGGVLTATQATGGRLTGLVLGCGINVTRTPFVEPSAFVPVVASLPDLTAGSPPSLRACLAAFLERIAAQLAEVRAAGPGSLLAAYREHSIVVGREIGVWPEGTTPARRVADLPPPHRRGRVEAIADDLSLRLVGQSEPVLSGRLAILDG